MKFYWYSIEISKEFQLDFQLILNEFPLVIYSNSHWYFIEISTGFPMVFYWYQIEQSIELTGFPMAFHWHFIEISIKF